VEDDQLRLVFDSDGDARKVLTEAHLPFQRWTEGADEYAEYGCAFSFDGKRAAVVRAGRCALVDLESGSVIHQAGFRFPSGSTTRPEVRMNESGDVFMRVESFGGRHLYRWRPGGTNLMKSIAQ